MQYEELISVRDELKELAQDIDKLIKARKENEKIADEWRKKYEYAYAQYSPVEAGIVKARSLIVSRKLVQLRKMNLEDC